MRLSASQISTYRDCKRKWLWSRKIKGEPSPAAELGGLVHKELERFMGGGSLDFTCEAGNIAASGLEHLPKPNTPGLLIEEEFHFEGPSGCTYLGYKDLFVPPELNFATFGMPVGVIIDYKTTGDLKWQKTPEDLSTDVQATLYAVDFFRTHQDAESVELKWVYLTTKKTRKSAVTKLFVTPKQTWEQFLKIEDTAREMAAITTDNPLDLEPTVEHCSAYGGCPYQGNCNLSPFDKIKGAAAQALVTLSKKPQGDNMSLLDRLKANKAIQATPVAVVPAAINPPEWQPPPVPDAPPPMNDVLAATMEKMAHGGTVVPIEGTSLPSKRGPGRPRKAAAEVVEAPALVAAAPTPAAVAPSVAAAPPVAASVPAPVAGKKISHLYVDCRPNVQYTDASVLILAAKARIFADTNLADYRFADYGKGPGMLSVATAFAVDNCNGAIEHLVVDSTTPEGSAVLMDLVARSQVVVR